MPLWGIQGGREKATASYNAAVLEFPKGVSRAKKGACYLLKLRIVHYNRNGGEEFGETNFSWVNPN